MTYRTAYKFKLNPTENLVEDLLMFAGTRRWVWSNVSETPINESLSEFVCQGGCQKKKKALAP